MDLHQRVERGKVWGARSVHFYTASPIFEKEHVRITVRIRGYAAEAKRSIGPRGVVRKLVNAGNFQQGTLGMVLLSTADSKPYH